MAKTRLQKHDVRDAIAHFRATEGKIPGQHRLLQYIGHGSFVRLKKLLYELESEEAERLLPSGKPLPDPITGLIDQLWAELDRYAQAREQDQDNRTAEALADMRRELAAAKADQEGLVAQLDAKHDALAAATQDNAVMAGRIHALETQLARTEGALSSRDQTLAAYDQQLDQARATLAAAEQQAATREAQWKAAIKNEEEKAFSQQQALNQHIAERDERVQELGKALEYFQQELRSSEDRRRKQEQQLATLESELTRIKSALGKEQQQLSRANQALDDARQAQADRDVHADRLEQENAVLTQRLEAAQSRNDTLQGQMSEFTEQLEQQSKQLSQLIKAQSGQPDNRG